MSAEFSHRPQFFDGMSFFPRVSRYDGRAIEEAMAGQNLFDEAVNIHGTVVEAAFAASDPPLLARLREGQVARLIRVEQVHGHLLAAREHAEVVTRTLNARGVDAPSLEHLDRWLGVLSRTAGALAPAV